VNVIFCLTVVPEVDGAGGEGEVLFPVVLPPAGVGVGDADADADAGDADADAGDADADAGDADADAGDADADALLLLLLVALAATMRRRQMHGIDLEFVITTLDATFNELVGWL